MDNWFNLYKLLILLYVCLQYLMGESTGAAAVVLCLLLYICLNIPIHFVKARPLRLLACGLSIGLSIACAVVLSPQFIFFLPMNFYDIATISGRSLWQALIAVCLPPFWLPENSIAPYLLIGAAGFVVYRLAYLSSLRIQSLIGEREALQEKIRDLAGKLEKDADYERQLRYSSQLEERNEIAQAIHDKLGHALSGSLLQLEAARMYLDKDRAQSEAILQNVIGILRAGTESIRAALKDLKPPREQLGINRVRLMIEEMCVNSHLRHVLLHQGDLERISPVQWKIIGDNIHEALANTMKHARATSVTIGIEVLNKYVKAEVKDDGIGASSIKKGLGLSGMEERSGGLGGQVIVDGSDGFSLITLLPLEGE